MEKEGSKGDKGGGLGKKSKGLASPTSQATQKDKGKKSMADMGYDDTRFTGKIEEKFYNRVWIKNGAVIEREFHIDTFEDLGFGFLGDFTRRGWVGLAEFKAESILTLCQEFMSNIRHKPVIEKGKEKMVSWVRGTKLIVTPNTFADIFGIPRVENPDFAFPDVGQPDLATISRELLLEGDT